MQPFFYLAEIVIMLPTTNSCCKSFNLASDWTKIHVSEGKADEAGEGAHRGDKEVCHSQVHQDVVQMRAELLVCNSACNSQDVDRCTSQPQEKHKR